MAMDELHEIKEKLASIESLLQRMPEMQAAVFFQMMEEYNTAKLMGKSTKELWVIPHPGQR